MAVWYLGVGKRAIGLMWGRVRLGLVLIEVGLIGELRLIRFVMGWRATIVIGVIVKR